jgi:hypothetical protein
MPGEEQVVETGDGKVRPVEKGQSGTWRVLVALAGPAVLAIVIYTGAEKWDWSILGVAGIVGICAFAVGALLGFLFGIPQYLAKGTAATPTDKASYQPNTNLTQVSDWLTKIIIGVGLVQFGQLTHTIGDLGDSLEPSLGGSPNGKPFGIALVVGFFVIGFLCSYLYTRLRLQWAFAQADRGAFESTVEEIVAENQAEKEKKEEQALTLGKRQIDPKAAEPSRDELKEALLEASPVAKAQLLTEAQTAAQAPEEGASKRAQVVIDTIKDSGT